MKLYSILLKNGDTIKFTATGFVDLMGQYLKFDRKEKDIRSITIIGE